jgi:hypothetical protein
MYDTLGTVPLNSLKMNPVEELTLKKGKGISPGWKIMRVYLLRFLFPILRALSGGGGVRFMVMVDFTVLNIVLALREDRRRVINMFKNS